MGVNNGVTYLINGKPFFSASWDNYGPQQFSVSNIQKVEVIKHNTNTTSGTNFGSAIINIVTKSPAVENVFNGNTIVQNNMISAGSFITQKRDNVSYSIQTQISKYFIQDSNEDAISEAPEINQFNINGRFFVHNILGSNSLLNIDLLKGTERRQGGNTRNFENVNASNSDNIKNENTGLGLRYNTFFSNASTLTFNFSTFNTDRFNTTRNTNGAENTTNIFDINNTKRYISTEIKTPLYKKHLIVFGLEHTQETLDEKSRELNSDNRFNSIGFFISDKYAVNSKTSLTSVFRIHHNSLENNSRSIVFNNTTISPTFYIQHKSNDNFKSFLSLSSNFQNPLLYSESLITNNNLSSVFMPNGLRSAQHNKLGLGLSYKYKKNSLHTNFYYTITNNTLDSHSITQRTLQNEGYQFQWANVGDSYNFTTEIGSSHILTPFLNLDTSLTYTSAQLKSNRSYINALDNSNKVFFTPEMTASLLFNAFNTHNTSYFFELKYIGSLYAPKDNFNNLSIDEVNKTTPYFLVNINANKKLSLFKKYPINLNIGVKNLFDYTQEDLQEFNTIATFDSSYAFAPLVGRFIHFGANIEF